MQNTSSAYKEKIRLNSRPYDEVYGSVVFSDGTTPTLTVSPANIPDDAVNIASQCTSGNDIEFGDVSSRVLNMSLLTDVSRYAFYGATVNLDYRIDINGTFETVHLGIFTITEAERDGNLVTFKAYDSMRKLDVGLPADAISGSPWEMFEFISEACDYPLAFDEQFILDNFTNTSTEIYLDSTSGIKTYRDAVKVVCQNLGCCARDNRQGYLELYDPHTVVDAELSASDWYSITVADYTCHYVGLTVTSAKGTFSSISSVEDEGNIMQIPDAPAWDYGVLTELQLMTDRLFNKLSGIIYTPCTIDMPSDASFDCGDRLEVTLPNGDTVETIITSYEWKWHGGMSIESKGTNPYQDGVSTSDIASTRLLEKQGEGSKFNYYTYENAGIISLTQSFSRICRIRFIVGDTTTVTLWHEFKWLNTLASENQEITLNYYLDGTKFDYEPVHTYGESGTHTWGTQFWLQDVEAGAPHEWEVRAKINSGSCVISRGDLHALIQGQNLAPSDRFNGEITIEDEFTPIRLHRRVVPIGEDIDFEYSAPDPDIKLTQTIEPLRLHRRIVPLGDNFNITREKEQYYLVTEEIDGQVYNIGTEGGDTLIT